MQVDPVPSLPQSLPWLLIQNANSSQRISGLCSGPCCLASPLSCPSLVFLIVSSAPSYLHVLLTVHERTHLNILIWRLFYLHLSQSTEKAGHPSDLVTDLSKNMKDKRLWMIPHKMRDNEEMQLKFTAFHWMPMRNFTSPEVSISSIVETNNIFISLFAWVARKLIVPLKYKLIINALTIGK